MEKKVLNKVKMKIKQLNYNMNWQKTIPVLRVEKVTSSLESLLSIFIIVKIDEVPKNYALKCKKFYINCPLAEVGIINNSNIRTY